MRGKTKLSGIAIVIFILQTSLKLRPVERQAPTQSSSKQPVRCSVFGCEEPSEGAEPRPGQAVPAAASRARGGGVGGSLLSQSSVVRILLAQLFRVEFGLAQSSLYVVEVVKTHFSQSMAAEKQIFLVVKCEPQQSKYNSRVLPVSYTDVLAPSPEYFPSIASYVQVRKRTRYTGQVSSQS